MGVLGLIPLLLALCGGAFAYLRQASENRAAILRRSLSLLEDASLEAPWFGPQTLRGSLGGRALSVSVGHRPALTTLRREARYPITARLELRNPPQVSLRIRRDAGLAALEKALGRVQDVEVSGGDGFDRRYLVEAGDEESRAGLAAREVRDAIHRLIARWELEEVSVAEGWVVVRGDTRLLGKTLLRELLVAMDLLAHAYDRVPLTQVSARPVFAWVGGEDARPRCPYCHDSIEGSEEETGTCLECGTLIHSECHEELGRCAILGCGGQGLERQGPIRID